MYVILQMVEWQTTDVSVKSLEGRPVTFSSDPQALLLSNPNHFCIVMGHLGLDSLTKLSSGIVGPHPTLRIPR